MSTTGRAPRDQVTRQLSGAAKSRFLRRVVDEAGAAPEVGVLLDARVVQVLVTESVPARGLARQRPQRRVKSVSPVAAAREAAPAVEVAVAPASPSPAAVVAPPAAPAPRPTGKAAKRGKPSQAAAASPAAPAPPQPAPAVAPAVAAPAFNPYGFSAMAVLLNEGRPALEALLAPVTAREQVVKLAEAQSVRIDPALLADKSADVEALRTAFIDAVAQRVAHRRAIAAG